MIPCRAVAIKDWKKMNQRQIFDQNSNCDVEKVLCNFVFFSINIDVE